MEDILRQFQEELRLLREEREKDKVIRLALEKKLQEVGILEAPQEVQAEPITVADEVAPVDLSTEVIDLADLSDLTDQAQETEEQGEQEEVQAHHEHQQDQVSVNPAVASSKPEPTTPSRSSKLNATTPTKPIRLFDSNPSVPGGSTVMVSLKAKKKKAHADVSAFTLSASRRAKYMEGISLLSITPPARAVSISRAALNAEYGCTTMGLLWRSPKGGKQQFLFPNYDLNPDMPRGPGEPGLIFGCRDELWTYGPWTLFYHLTDSKFVRMGYAGEYKCQVVGTMSKEEFASQPDLVKKAWADKIATHLRYECYVAIRARITLRKENPLEDPTNGEVKAKVQQIKRMKRGTPPELTCEDVINAFSRGEESIKVIRAECVGYDHAKAEQYLPLQDKYEEKQKLKGSGKAKAPARSSAKTVKKTRKPTKARKRAILFVSSSDDGEADQDVVLESEESDNSQQSEALKSVPRRPAKRLRYTSPSRRGDTPQDSSVLPDDSAPQRPTREKKKTFKALHGE